MQKSGDTPCKQRFNIKDAKKCLAKTRSDTLCQSPAMKNGRCRMHGGKSTGAKTKEGIRRIENANLIHGFYSKENVNFQKEISLVLKESRDFLMNKKKNYS